jgi:hypothetical protein
VAGPPASHAASHPSCQDGERPTATRNGNTRKGCLLAGGLLIVFVARYARLRAGTRATIAIAAGLVGIAAGVGEAGYYTLENGPSGDDYTGLLAIPAGLLLAGVGAATLWRTRRLDDRLA